MTRPLFALVALALPAAGPAPQRPAWLPDPALTPGQVLPVTAADVCRPGYAGGARAVPDSRKRAVYARYGLTPDAAAYEVDHLIPLTLGGANTVLNLFPQPYAPPPAPDGRRYGAHEKDRLEVRLNREVCAGRLGLAEAQAAFRGDWTAAYRKYFGAMPGGVAP